MWRRRLQVGVTRPARRSVSLNRHSLNLPYPVGYASGIIVIDHAGSWRRGDALHIAAIRRCLRHAIL